MSVPAPRRLSAQALNGKGSLTSLAAFGARGHSQSFRLYRQQVARGLLVAALFVVGIILIIWGVNDCR